MLTKKWYLTLLSPFKRGIYNWFVKYRLIVRSLKIGFIVLMIVSAVVWIIGILAGAVVPLFGGIRAERFGEIAFSLGITGEVLTYACGWMRKRTLQNRSEQFKGFGGGKRYG